MSHSGDLDEGCRQSLAQARCPSDAKCKQERKWLRWRPISGCANGMKRQATDASEKGTGCQGTARGEVPNFMWILLLMCSEAY